MDIDTLLSLAADAGVSQDGGDAAASADEGHPEWQQAARHWRAKYAASQRGRGAKDGLLDGDSLRSAELRAQVAWANREQASSQDYRLNIGSEVPKVKGTGRWKQRTGEQVMRIVSSSRKLSQSSAVTMPSGRL